MIGFLKFNKFKFLLIFLLFFQCISFERGIKSKLIFSGVNVAVYKMEDSPVKFPISEINDSTLLEDKLIKNLLYSIRKEKSIFPTSSKETLWSLETIEEITLVARDVLSSKNLGKFFLVVVKEEDPLSPFSRIFRTTFYFLREGNKIHFIFGEVNQNINFLTQYGFTDWANPSFFSVTCLREKTIGFSGKLEKSFSYQKDSTCLIENSNLEGNESKKEENFNYRWVTVQIQTAIQLGKESAKPLDKANISTREKRLEELLRLYKKGLIDKEDYELKKAEILGEL